MNLFWIQSESILNPFEIFISHLNPIWITFVSLLKLICIPFESVFNLINVPIWIWFESLLYLIFILQEASAISTWKMCPKNGKISSKTFLLLVWICNGDTHFWLLDPVFSSVGWYLPFYIWFPLIIEEIWRPGYLKNMLLKKVIHLVLWSVMTSHHIFCSAWNLNILLGESKNLIQNRCWITCKSRLNRFFMFMLITFELLLNRGWITFESCLNHFWIVFESIWIRVWISFESAFHVSIAFESLGESTFSIQNFPWSDQNRTVLKLTIMSPYENFNAKIDTKYVCQFSAKIQILVIFDSKI